MIYPLILLQILIMIKIRVKSMNTKINLIKIHKKMMMMKLKVSKKNRMMTLNMMKMVDQKE